MRKKQSVTQRVVLDDDASENKEETPGDSDSVKLVAEEQEMNPYDGSTTQSRADDSVDESASTEPHPVKDKEVSQNVETSKADTVSKEGKSDVLEQHNLFDEDGNAILPDGTLIIQPTDVDGDRPSSGPAPPPSEGSSLQFDFKDGNPDPKYIMSSQSMGGGGSSLSGSASEPGVLDVVKCTTCTTKLNPYHKDDLAVHPVLKVITCKRCMRWYNSVDWSKDEDGKDNQCRWCGEGGQLICCDVCHNTFCKTCIKRNLGRSVLQEIEDLPEDALWRCYVCDQGPLLPLQQSCAQIIEKVEAYRMGKLQRKFKLQTGKKQCENKKPLPVAPTTVTVSVTPVPGIRPQIGVRMTTPSVVTSSTHVGPRSSVTSNPTNTQARAQFTARLVPSMPRGPRLPMPNSGILMNPGGGANVGHRSAGNVIQSNQPPGRYPGTQVRPQTAVRTMRPVGRPSNMSVGHSRSLQGTQSMNVAAAAGSSAATEEWYEQNCSLREILREVNSVDPSNIELALKTTLKELQSWTRKCNHLENELRGALNDAQRRTVVHKFKSTFRLNLLLRLGKIHTLMQKESGLQMAVAAQRSAVMAAQAQSQVGRGVDLKARSSHLTTPVINANAKKLIVSSNRPGIPNVSNRIPPVRVTGGVIDLTEDNSGQANKLLPSASSNMAAIGSRISNVVGKAEIKPTQTSSGPMLNNSVASTSSSARAKVRQRASNSTHVNLLSSEDEDDDDDGMVDDRTDKTWSGSISRPSGLRRKSARLAAKTVPSSVTEGSESSQGVDESDDSQSRLLVRVPHGKRGKRSKKTDEESKKIDADDCNENNDSKDPSALPSATDTTRDESKVKDEAMEVVADASVLSAEKSNKDADQNESKKSGIDAPDESGAVNNHDKKENGETSVITNGICTADESSNSHDKTEQLTNQSTSGDNQLLESTSSAETAPVVKTESQSVAPAQTDPATKPQLTDNFSSAEKPVEDEVCTNSSKHADDEISHSVEEKQEDNPSNDVSQTLDPPFVEVSGSDQNSTSEVAPESETNVSSTNSSRASRKCITVSMWGPATDGEELLMDSTESIGNDSDIGSLKGKRRASELESDENVKRQKLDQ